MRAVAGALLSLSVIALSGCAPTESPPAVAASTSPTSPTSPTSTPTPITTPSASSLDPAPAPAPISIAVVGDSNSTGFLGTLEAGSAAGVAWVSQLPSGEFLSAGGWAVDGATTAAMAAAAFPIPGAHVLVILGGTNDLAIGVPADEVMDNLERIADVVGVPEVVIAAIPPLDFLPQEAMDLNAALAEFAASKSWAFVDPWLDARNADGTWVREYYTDGVHTSREGYAAAAAQIARQLILTDR